MKALKRRPPRLFLVTKGGKMQATIPTWLFTQESSEPTTWLDLPMQTTSLRINDRLLRFLVCLLAVLLSLFSKCIFNSSMSSIIYQHVFSVSSSLHSIFFLVISNFSGIFLRINTYTVVGHAMIYRLSKDNKVFFFLIFQQCDFFLLAHFLLFKTLGKVTTWG